MADGLLTLVGSSCTLGVHVPPPLSLPQAPRSVLTTGRQNTKNEARKWGEKVRDRAAQPS